MAGIHHSTTFLSKDIVRLPTSVNDLGEFLTSISDSLREAGGNKIAAYSLSSLEQYIPAFLVETVRIIASGEGLPPGSTITLNGIEALDRSGSVLYRDLKGATSFENSSWDEELAADCFEYSASFIGLMEFDVDELLNYFRNNRDQFGEEDVKLMFTMDGPRRKGDFENYKKLQNDLNRQDLKNLIKDVRKESSKRSLMTNM